MKRPGKAVSNSFERVCPWMVADYAGWFLLFLSEFYSIRTGYFLATILEDVSENSVVIPLGSTPATIGSKPALGNSNAILEADFTRLPSPFVFPDLVYRGSSLHTAGNSVDLFIRKEQEVRLRLFPSRRDHKAKIFYAIADLISQHHKRCIVF